LKEITNLPKTQPLPIDPDVDVRLKPKESNEQDTVIYRSGSGNGTNLTPREKDNQGLSYSTEKPLSGKYTKTTIKTVNATLTLKAVQDGPTHVSVTPVEYPISTTTMEEWIKSRPTANENPHPYTTTLQIISVKEEAK